MKVKIVECVAIQCIFVFNAKMASQIRSGKEPAYVTSIFFRVFFSILILNGRKNIDICLLLLYSD